MKLVSGKLYETTRAVTFEPYPLADEDFPDGVSFLDCERGTVLMFLRADSNFYDSPALNSNPEGFPSPLIFLGPGGRLITSNDEDVDRNPHAYFKLVESQK